MDPRYGDMSEHRVSMLGSSLRRAEDPENSRDPRVRELVAALKTVDYAPAPDPRFRAELRAQLVAVAPRIIAESAPSTQDDAGTARDTLTAGSPLSAQLRRRRFTRPLGIAAGVAAAFLMLFGGAVWQSQKSLPGDSLYGLKRASENVQLALASGGTDRGHEYLSLAQKRVQEAQALLHRDSASAAGQGTLAGGLSQHTAELIASNLASADSDLTHGADLLNTQAVKAKSQTPISVIDGWAPRQLVRLTELAAALPTGSLQNRTHTSWTLTQSALTRARSLAPAVASGCASTSTSDSLGPVPTCAATAPGTPSSSPTPKATTTPQHRVTGTPTGTSRSTEPATRRSATTPAAEPHASSTPARSSSSAGHGLPTLLPKSPLSIGRCGISVSIGPVGVGVGGCPSHS